jgi:hypothetical protein
LLRGFRIEVPGAREVPGPFRESTLDGTNIRQAFLSPSRKLEIFVLGEIDIKGIYMISDHSSPASRSICLKPAPDILDYISGK